MDSGSVETLQNIFQSVLFRFMKPDKSYLFMICFDLQFVPYRNVTCRDTLFREAYTYAVSPLRDGDSCHDKLLIFLEIEICNTIPSKVGLVL